MMYMLGNQNTLSKYSYNRNYSKLICSNNQSLKFWFSLYEYYSILPQIYKFELTWTIYKPLRFLKDTGGRRLINISQFNSCQFVFILFSRPVQVTIYSASPLQYILYGVAETFIPAVVTPRHLTFPQRNAHFLSPNIEDLIAAFIWNVSWAYTCFGVPRLVQQIRAVTVLEGQQRTIFLNRWTGVFEYGLALDKLMFKNLKVYKSSLQN